jgi:hypothetical protein
MWKSGCPSSASAGPVALLCGTSSTRGPPGHHNPPLSNPSSAVSLWSARADPLARVCKNSISLFGSTAVRSLCEALGRCEALPQPAPHCHVCALKHGVPAGVKTGSEARLHLLHPSIARDGVPPRWQGC